MASWVPLCLVGITGRGGCGERKEVVRLEGVPPLLPAAPPSRLPRLGVSPVLLRRAAAAPVCVPVKRLEVTPEAQYEVLRKHQ